MMVRAIGKSRRYAIGGLESVLVCIIGISIFMTCSLVPNMLLAGTSNKTIAPKNAAQEQEKAIPPKTSRTIVMDSRTGYTVFPEELIIFNKDDQILYQNKFTKEEAIKKFKDGVIPQSFLNSLGLPPGNYMCAIITKNYERGGSFCRVGSESANEIISDEGSAKRERTESLLTPKVLPPEIRNDYIRSLHKAGTMIVAGFVVDDESGFPLEKARVALSGGSVHTLTDERGYFLLRFLVSEDGESPDALATVDIVFEKNGFESVERQYVAIWSKGDAIYRIRLERGEGRKVIDERKTRRWGQVPDRK